MPSQSDFFADSVELGIDEAEEVYSVLLTASNCGGGPPRNYLLLQRSVTGIGDDGLKEPYIELDDPSNGRFAQSVLRIEVFPRYLHVVFAPESAIQASDPTGQRREIDDAVIRYDADAQLQRRMKYALELVVADGFPMRFVS